MHQHEQHHHNTQSRLALIEREAVHLLTCRRSEVMLNDPSEAPTHSILPSDASNRVATACETFSTCRRKAEQNATPSVVFQP